LDPLREGDLGALDQAEGLALLHEQAAILEEAYELLRVQGIPSGALEDE
jgi:hypothetical protein